MSPRHATSAPRYKRALLPLPVTRAAHWQLVCVCGIELNRCGCPVKEEDVHVEIWPDGCQMMQRFYPQPGAPPPLITPKTPSQECFITRLPGRPRTEGPAPAPPVTPPRLTDEAIRALAVRWHVGERATALAQEAGISLDTFYYRARVLGIAKPSRSVFVGQESALAALCAQGLSQGAIARQYGVDASLVCKVLRRLGLATGWQRKSDTG